MNKQYLSRDYLKSKQYVDDLKKLKIHKKKLRDYRKNIQKIYGIVVF